MRKLQKWKIMIALLLVLQCSACALSAPTVEDLLRAPRLSGDYSEIQTALEAEFGTSVQLCYPTEGLLLSPFTFGDLDGDGIQEVAVSFVTKESTVVQLALMKQAEDKSWYLFDKAAGLSDTVGDVQLLSMQKNNTRQILATYYAQGEQYVAVYAMAEAGFVQLLGQPCAQYLVEDLTGNGVDDVILISGNEAQNIQMEVFSYGNAQFSKTPVPSLSSDLFSEYLNISVGEGGAYRRYLILDGLTSEEPVGIASEIFWFNLQTYAFEKAPLIATDDLYRDSKRYLMEFTSRDIDGDGVIEIPIQPNSQGEGLLDYVQKRRVSFVKWIDFTSYYSEKSFGLYDEEYGYYIELPWELDGNLMAVDGEQEGEIVLRNLSGDVTYLSLCMTELSEIKVGWKAIGVVKSKQIQVKTDPSVEEFLKMEDLEKSIHILEK